MILISKKHKHNAFGIVSTLTIICGLLFLTGCSESDDDGSGIGYVQLYNISYNAPPIVLTVDQDDDSDFDSWYYSGVSYKSSTGFVEITADTYDIDLSWQDGDSLDDLENVYESSMNFNDDTVKLIVVSDDIQEPTVDVYDIDIIDDDDDETDDLFNLRFLNKTHKDYPINVYYSKPEETFNEAELLGQFNIGELSDNIKIEEDDYVFYMTDETDSEVIYQSDEVIFYSSNQYVFVIREDNSLDSTALVMDRLTQGSTATEYASFNAEAQISVYNGIVEHELLENYTSSFDFIMNGANDSQEILGVDFNEFSGANTTAFGDYSLSLKIPNTEEYIIQNHLLTLSANDDKTVFFHLVEESVDEDGDGNVDEDGDGEIDEIEIRINSLIVENSDNGSIYSHQVNVINLVDDYESVKVYFVRNNETIEDANYSVTSYFVEPESISLLNNSYTVYVIAKDDSTDLVLATQELILDEDSSNSFLILEEVEADSENYRLTLTEQNKTF